jgi:hypothetical protein
LTPTLEPTPDPRPRYCILVDCLGLPKPGVPNISCEPYDCNDWTSTMWINSFCGPTEIHSALESRCQFPQFSRARIVPCQGTYSCPDGAPPGVLGIQCLAAYRCSTGASCNVCGSGNGITTGGCWTHLSGVNRSSIWQMNICLW